MSNLTELILVAPILLFSMVAHEYAHGYIAYRNGDPTAYQLGRLTWNPIKHIDPFLTILLPVILALSHAPILGGAKPVPVNPRNYRNFKKGDIMVSLAGVTMNVILALVCTLVIPILYGIAHLVPRMGEGLALVQEMFIYGITINLLLAAFNLIPIPPLDGSHVFKYLLPPAWALTYQRVGRYGLLLLYALLFFGGSLLFTWFQPVFWMSSWLVKLVLQFVLPLPISLSL